MRLITLSFVTSLGLGLFLFAAERSVKVPAPAPVASLRAEKRFSFEPVTVVGDAHAQLDEPAQGGRAP
jgi:hypothetical protein